MRIGGQSLRKLMMIISLLSIVGLQISCNSKPETAPDVGFLAPDFTLKTTGGSTVKLSDLRGYPVLINFWASWCGPCRSEMPDIQRAFNRHNELIVLGINQEESRTKAADFVRSFNLTFPILLDSNGKVAEAYRVNVLPVSFFVDADGIIRARHFGSMSTNLLESHLVTILSEH